MDRLQIYIFRKGKVSEESGPGSGQESEGPEGGGKKLSQAQAQRLGARLENLHIWQMEKVKTTKKASIPMAIGWLPGERRGEPGMCTWGAVPGMDAEAALQKARAMKARQ